MARAARRCRGYQAICTGSPNTSPRRRRAGCGADDQGTFRAFFYATPRRLRFRNFATGIGMAVLLCGKRCRSKTAVYA